LCRYVGVQAGEAATGRSGRFSSPHFFACAAHIGVVSRSSLTFDCRVHGFNISAFGVARESRSRKNVDASCSRSFARPRAANQLIARQLWPFNLRGVCAAYLAKTHVATRRQVPIRHSCHAGSNECDRAWLECHTRRDESRLGDSESHGPWGESRLEDSESQRAMG